MIPEWLIAFNSFAWIASNLLIIYIAFALVVFVVSYVILFDPRATTGGKLVFQFAVSLIGVIGLVFIGVFVNPVENRAWWTFPGDVFWWRPVVRLIVFGYVSFTITSLAILLGVRKFAPGAMRTPRDIELVKARSDKK